MTLAAVLAGTQAWHVETTDVLAGLRMLPDGCVQTVCTSPPYMGLRAYSTEPQVWGGAADCAHAWFSTTRRSVQPALSAHTTLGEGPRGLGGRAHWDALPASQQGTCTRCGAWRGELGSEPTPALFVAHLVAVLAEVKRVLRDDGTVWLNIADSYSSQGGATPGRTGASTLTTRADGTRKYTDANVAARRADSGISAKSLCLIPERLALALSDDGWIIRSHIVYAKLAPMPESVTDRPTSAWEHVWLLTKRGKYFYDSDAVREPTAAPTGGRQRAALAQDDRYVGGVGNEYHEGRPGRFSEYQPTVANQRNVWTLSEGDTRYRLRADLTPEQRAYVLERLAAHDRRGLM